MSNIINVNASAAYSYQNFNASVNKDGKGGETSLSAIYESLDLSSSIKLDLSFAAGNESETGKIDLDRVKAIKEDFGRNIDAFKQMVLKLFDGQSAVGNVAIGNLRGLIDRIDKAGGIDELTKSQAQEMISEEGYWGVEKTSARILDFAKALSSNDASKIDLLRNAFQKGYDQAAKLWGGELPEISKNTYDKVMKGFDEWAASGVSEETEE